MFCKIKCTCNWFYSWSNSLMPWHWKERNEGVGWGHSPHLTSDLWPSFLQIFFYPSFFLLLLQLPTIMYMLLGSMVSCRFVNSVHFSSLLFSFCSPVGLSSSVLSLSSTCSDHLFSPSSKVFISVIVEFWLENFYFCFYNFPSLHWHSYLVIHILMFSFISLDRISLNYLKILIIADTKCLPKESNVLASSGVVSINCCFSCI